MRKTIKQYYKTKRDAENKKRPNTMPIKLDSLIASIPSYHRMLFQALISKVEELDKDIKSLQNIINKK